MLELGKHHLGCAARSRSLGAVGRNTAAASGARAEPRDSQDAAIAHEQEDPAGALILLAAGGNGTAGSPQQGTGAAAAAAAAEPLRLLEAGPLSEDAVTSWGAAHGEESRGRSSRDGGQEGSIGAGMAGSMDVDASGAVSDDAGCENHQRQQQGAAGGRVRVKRPRLEASHSGQVPSPVPPTSPSPPPWLGAVDLDRAVAEAAAAVKAAAAAATQQQQQQQRSSRRPCRNIRHQSSESFPIPQMHHSQQLHSDHALVRSGSTALAPAQLLPLPAPPAAVSTPVQHDVMQHGAGSAGALALPSQQLQDAWLSAGMALATALQQRSIPANVAHGYVPHAAAAMRELSSTASAGPSKVVVAVTAELVIRVCSAMQRETQAARTEACARLARFLRQYPESCWLQIIRSASIVTADPRLAAAAAASASAAKAADAAAPPAAGAAAGQAPGPQQPAEAQQQQQQQDEVRAAEGGEGSGVVLGAPDQGLPPPPVQQQQQQQEEQHLLPPVQQQEAEELLPVQEVEQEALPANGPRQPPEDCLQEVGGQEQEPDEDRMQAEGEQQQGQQGQQSDGDLMQVDGGQQLVEQRSTGEHAAGSVLADMEQDSGQPPAPGAAQRREQQQHEEQHRQQQQQQQSLEERQGRSQLSHVYPTRPPARLLMELGTIKDLPIPPPLPGGCWYAHSSNASSRPDRPVTKQPAAFTPVPMPDVVRTRDPVFAAQMDSLVQLYANPASPSGHKPQLHEAAAAAQVRQGAAAAVQVRQGAAAAPQVQQQVQESPVLQHSSAHRPDGGSMPDSAPGSQLAALVQPSPGASASPTPFALEQPAGMSGADVQVHGKGEPGEHGKCEPALHACPASALACT